MKQFDYTITDEIGIHARPAGMLVKQASQFESTIKIKNGEKEANAKKLLNLMSLAVKNGNTITVTIEGADEEKAAETMETFFKENL